MAARHLDMFLQFMLGLFLSSGLEESCEELKQLLLDRGYKRGAIKAARDKALAIPRSEALKKVVREKTTSRVVLAITHHPKLPSVPKIVNRHWRMMESVTRIYVVGKHA